MKRERRGERTKLAAQISLKGDASLLKFSKSTWATVCTRNLTGDYIANVNFFYDDIVNH